MEYLTSSETAKVWGISSRRVTLLCSEGRVEGSVKKGLMWLIPYTAKNQKIQEKREHSFYKWRRENACIFRIEE